MDHILLQKMLKTKGSKKDKGDKGENAAVFYLSEMGFDIVDRNLKIQGGEIDIVAFRNNRFHFIEVKSCFGRTAEGEMEMSERIGIKKIKKIEKTALNFLERVGREDHPWSIDLVMVFFSYSGDLLEIKIMEDIFL